MLGVSPLASRPSTVTHTYPQPLTRSPGPTWYFDTCEVCLHGVSPGLGLQHQLSGRQTGQHECVEPPQQQPGQDLRLHARQRHGGPGPGQEEELGAAHVHHRGWRTGRGPLPHPQAVHDGAAAVHQPQRLHPVREAGQHTCRNVK